MNLYNINTSDASIRGPIVSLKVLYDGMPETSGCERCQDVNKENAIWCCRHLNPHMYYVEFLHIWEDIQMWSKEKKLALVLRAIHTHLDTAVEKGCIAWDSKCLIYERRPFSCRLYGVISPESWDIRVAALRKRYEKDSGEALGQQFESFIRHDVQCDMVRTSSGEPISKTQEDVWFRHTRHCEERIGISPLAIIAHDESGGSYRTLHDHLLMTLFDQDSLTTLSKLRLREPETADIDSFVEVLAHQLQANGVI